MNRVKNTLILVLVSAALACSGNNQTNSGANTANKTNANANKAEANVYKDYPGDTASKAPPVAENYSDVKKEPTTKSKAVKTESVNNPKSVSRASADEPTAFKFNSKKTFTVAAKVRATRGGKPIVKPTPTPADPPEESHQ